MPWSRLREAFGEDKVGRSDGARRRVDDCHDRLVRRCVAQEGSLRRKSPARVSARPAYGTVSIRPDRTAIVRCVGPIQRGNVVCIALTGTP